MTCRAGDLFVAREQGVIKQQLTKCGFFPPDRPKIAITQGLRQIRRHYSLRQSHQNPNNKSTHYNAPTFTGNMSQRLQNEKSAVIEMRDYFRFNAANVPLGGVLRWKDS